MSWSVSSMEMIFWRSRTVFSAWIWSRRTAARSNFSSAAASSISRGQRRGEVVVLALQEALDVAAPSGA